MRGSGPHVPGAERTPGYLRCSLSWESGFFGVAAVSRWGLSAGQKDDRGQGLYQTKVGCSIGDPGHRSPNSDSTQNLASNPALPLPSHVASLPPRLFGKRRKN